VNILVVAPHPDDEVLGVGGTLLRYKSEGHSLAWLIVTKVPDEFGWSEERTRKREVELSEVERFFCFDRVYKLDFPSTQLDTVPVGSLVKGMSDVISEFSPDEIYIPHLGDVHTDHQIVHKAIMSCTKAFRYPCVKRVLVYETLSETDFGLELGAQFVPNVFVDISEFLEKKLQAMEIYASEMGAFPFPRSVLSIRSLAHYRGSSSGFAAAEAFQLLRERR
jgi:LmbE family N-acetylglucosaminyl deacetylase